jgi:hypothetical protein
VSVRGVLQTGQVLEKFGCATNVLPKSAILKQMVPEVQHQLLLTLVTPVVGRAVGLEEGSPLLHRLMEELSDHAEDE